MIRDVNTEGKGLTIKLPLREINNLYRPNSKYKSGTFDFVKVEDSLNRKFAPILIKEWFFLLKPGGLLTIEYIPTKDLTFQSVEELFWWLLRGNYDIKVHETGKRSSRIIVQKKKSMIATGDSIDKWSFGIVTNGERDDWLELIIKSIRDLKIPHYEIIVCGKYRDRKEKNFTYINFNERSDKGWITKKKNLIAERARYENLCVIHDRLVFDKNWYEGMKKYGNAFELLGCVQIEKTTGVQAGDWLTQGGPRLLDYRNARMLYTDWDYYTYLSGQLMIIKRSIWKRVLWNETRYWFGGDDVDTSFRARDLGFIIRFNPNSLLYALTWRYGILPLKYDRSYGLLPKDMLVRRSVRYIGRYLYRLPFVESVFLKLYPIFMKTPFYKRFLYG